jgi:hypothetical protein
MTAFRQMIDDLYASELAIDGLYAPVSGAPAFGVRVMKHEPDAAIDGFAARAVIKGISLAVRQSQVPAPAAGDILTTLDDAGTPISDFRVDAREADDQRLEWLLAVTEATP